MEFGQLKKKRLNTNVYRGLTPDLREKLRVAMLEAVFRVLKRQRARGHPPMELIEAFISEDIRRVAMRLSDGLARRDTRREYFAVYKGPGSRKAFKLIKVDVEDMVELKQVVEVSKPDWALRCEAFPLAYPLFDDKYYPFVIFWPQVKLYEKVPHASIRFSDSR